MATIVYINEKTGEKIPFFPIVKGNYFGDIDLIFEQTRKFSVLANTEVEVLALEIDQVKKYFFKMFRRVGIYLKARAKVKRRNQIKLYEKAKAVFDNHQKHKESLEEMQ